VLLDCYSVAIFFSPFWTLRSWQHVVGGIGSWRYVRKRNDWSR